MLLGVEVLRDFCKKCEKAEILISGLNMGVLLREVRF